MPSSEQAQQDPVIERRLAEAGNVSAGPPGPSDASVVIRMPGAQAYPLMQDRSRTRLFETGPESGLK